MSIAYLTGGERPDYVRMNLLVRELNDKLAKLLFGLSPAVAQPTTYFDAISGGFATSSDKLRCARLPADLLGKNFFFLNGKPTLYATAFPGYAVLNTVPVNWGGVDRTDVDNQDAVPYVPPYLGRSYDHAPFTALAAAANVIEHDEDRHLAITDTTLTFDDSLEAHYVEFQGEADDEPVPYYFRQQFAGEPVSDWPVKVYGQAERRHNFAVAEIIVDGLEEDGTWECDSAWTKYNFFRVHNLSLFKLTVQFGALVFDLPPLRCMCVRRDPDGQNARLQLPYFWLFEPGDPRSFWWPGPNSVSGSSWANNLANPQILGQWCKHFTNTGQNQPPDNTIKRAYFFEDEHEQTDCGPANPQFGAADNPATLIGDLIHHKGDLLLAKVLAADVEGYPTGTKRTIFEKVTFNGYETIVADFAAKGITVVADASGPLKLSYPPDALYSHVDLISLSTNLLKRGNDVPAVVLDITSPYLLESAIFEGNPVAVEDWSSVINYGLGAVVFDHELYWEAMQASLNKPPLQNPDYWRLTTTADYALSNSSRRFIGGPIVRATTTQNRTYHLIPGDTAVPVSADVYELRGVARTYYTGTNGGALPITTPQSTTVATLLATLEHFGVRGGPQNSAYSGYTDKSLRMTPSGLVLRYTESVLADAFEIDTTVNGYGFLFSAWNQDGSTGAFKLYAHRPVTGAVFEQGTLHPVNLDGINGEFFTRKGKITFRGHGWGELQTDAGRAAFHLPKYHRHPCRGYVEQWDGRDFSLDFKANPLRLSRSPYQILKRIRGEELTKFNDSIMVHHNDVFTLLAPYIGATENILFYNLYRVGFAATELPTNYSPAPESMALCAEHYNAIAREINARKTGQVLDWRFIKFLIEPTPDNFTYVSLDTSSKWGVTADATGFHGVANGGTEVPIPMNAFAVFESGSNMELLCELLGIPIKTMDDFDPDELAKFDLKNEIQVIVAKMGAVGGLSVTSQTLIPPGTISAHWDLTFSGNAACSVDFSELDRFEHGRKGIAHFKAPQNSYNRDRGADFFSTLNLPGGCVEVDLRAVYGNIRWVTIEDVGTAMEQFLDDLDLAVEFDYTEVCRPLSLAYLEKAADVEVEPFNFNQAVSVSGSLPTDYYDEVGALRTDAVERVLDSLNGSLFRAGRVGRNGAWPGTHRGRFIVTDGGWGYTGTAVTANDGIQTLTAGFTFKFSGSNGRMVSLPSTKGGDYDEVTRPAITITSPPAGETYGHEAYPARAILLFDDEISLTRFTKLLVFAVAADSDSAMWKVRGSNLVNSRPEIWNITDRLDFPREHLMAAAYLAIDNSDYHGPHQIVSGAGGFGYVAFQAGFGNYDLRTVNFVPNWAGIQDLTSNAFTSGNPVTTSPAGQWASAVLTFTDGPDDETWHQWALSEVLNLAVISRGEQQCFLFPRPFWTRLTDDWTSSYERKVGAVSAGTGGTEGPLDGNGNVGETIHVEKTDPQIVVAQDITVLSADTDERFWLVMNHGVEL